MFAQRLSERKKRQRSASGLNERLIAAKRTWTSQERAFKHSAAGGAITAQRRVSAARCRPPRAANGRLVLISEIGN